MAKPEVTSVAQYVAAQPAPVRRVLERVRATLRQALPSAVEGISYQMPIYKVDGRMVLYFAGYAKHYAIYPATPFVVDALGDAAAGLLHSKATLRFDYAGTVPTALITRIAKLRATEVAAEATGSASAARSTARGAAKASAGKRTAKTTRTTSAGGTVKARPRNARP